MAPQGHISYHALWIFKKKTRVSRHTLVALLLAAAIPCSFFTVASQITWQSAGLGMLVINLTISVQFWTKQRTKEWLKVLCPCHSFVSTLFLTSALNNSKIKKNVHKAENQKTLQQWNRDIERFHLSLHYQPPYMRTIPAQALDRWEGQNPHICHAT